MSSHSSILIYGNDSFLLQTRGWVLEKAGFAVETTTAFVDVSRIIASQPIQLLILCHTLSAEECDTTLATVHTLCSHMKNLIMTANGSRCVASDRDVLLNDFAGARTLVAMVQEIITPHPLDASSVAP